MGKIPPREAVPSSMGVAKSLLERRSLVLLPISPWFLRRQTNRGFNSARTSRPSPARVTPINTASGICVWTF
jgi:hypothetical protein